MHITSIPMKPKRDRAICILIYRFVIGWKEKIISMGATLPSVVTGFDPTSPPVCKSLPVWPLYMLSSIILVILTIYLIIRLHKICKSFPYTTKMKAQLNHVFLGQSMTSINLELFTSTRYMLVNLITVPVTPERLKITYDPTRLHCSLDTHLCFKVLNMETEVKPIIAIDSEPTTMELPSIYPISRARARALEQIIQSTGCTARLTVTCGIIQYDQCIITTVHKESADEQDQGTIIPNSFSSTARLQGQTGPYTGSQNSLQN